jgi:bifunctional DNA-binding transcriptional regulator/antitoxin component of YhaV-PrlF toxin-antitoxin module
MEERLICTVIVDAHGHIPLPLEVQQMLGVSPGDRIEFTETQGGYILSRLPTLVDAAKGEQERKNEEPR